MARNAKSVSRKSAGHHHNTIIAKQEVTMHREGPIPDSRELAEYENIREGFANRIVVMAEENGRHRREMEKLVLQSDLQNQKNMIENDRINIKSFNTGRWLGSFVSLVALSGAIYLGATGGSQGIAIALVALPVASIVQAIIGSYKKNGNDER